MKKNKFKINDSVQLKSGGVCMTVNSVIPKDDKIIYECVWQVKGTPKKFNYVEELLKLCNAKSPLAQGITR